MFFVNEVSLEKNINPFEQNRMSRITLAGSYDSLTLRFMMVGVTT